jgi:hypothetical protein
LPSGVSPNVAYELYEQYGGQDCLQKVDVAVVEKLMEDIGGEDLIRFVSKEYETQAQTVYNALNLPPVAFENVWDIFTAMMPHM